jgi:hypothetical protein
MDMGGEVMGEVGKGWRLDSAQELVLVVLDAHGVVALPGPRHAGSDLGPTCLQKTVQDVYCQEVREKRFWCRRLQDRTESYAQLYFHNFSPD